MSQMELISVFLFTGFLGAGKTTFLQDALERKDFCTGEKTLLLICEEGETEYDEQHFANSGVTVRVLEDVCELNREILIEYQREAEASRILIEYNGMWMQEQLYAAMPSNWKVFQEMLFIDSETFLVYNQNMRQLMYDKLKSCVVAVFNNCNANVDKMLVHKIVRAASRRADIVYQMPDGTLERDTIIDENPFDLEASMIEVNDNDYAIWYRDLSDEPEKYEGKTIRVKFQAAVDEKLPKGSFVVGRNVMVCCEEDIEFAGLVCEWEKAMTIRNNKWIVLTAVINNKYHSLYGKKWPVLTYVNATICEPPMQKIATFY